MAQIVTVIRKFRETLLFCLHASRPDLHTSFPLPPPGGQSPRLSFFFAGVRVGDRSSGTAAGIVLHSFVMSQICGSVCRRQSYCCRPENGPQRFRGPRSPNEIMATSSRRGGRAHGGGGEKRPESGSAQDSTQNWAIL